MRYQIIEMPYGERPISLYWQRGEAWIFASTLTSREEEAVFVQQAGLVLASQDRCGSWPRRTYREEN